jgi:regulatory protein
MPEHDPAETAEETTARALDAALNYLSYRQRTCREVQRKLAERGFDEEVIRAALARLENVGLVDDVAFIGAYVRDRIAHRPMGVRRMASELFVKGIGRDEAIPQIEATLAEEGIDEEAMAWRVGERKATSLRTRDEEQDLRRRRLRQHLHRRGFDPRLIREVVDGLLPRNGSEGGSSDKDGRPGG